MLLNLHVKNLATIDEIEVDFFDQLNILTGETGAGKSVLIGSVEAALGGKTKKGMIRQGQEFALIELTFKVENPDVIDALKERDIFPEEGIVTVSRKIYSNRNVCRINGETMNLSDLKSISGMLLDLCGQQENLTLRDKASQLLLLDRYGKDATMPLREQVSDKYKEYLEAKKEYDDFFKDRERTKRDIDYLNFSVNEIEAATLKIGEDEELEKQYRRQSHSRQMLGSLGVILETLEGKGDMSVSESISLCLRNMSGIEDIDESTESFSEQLNQIDDLVSGLTRDIRDYVEDLSFDDFSFKEMEDRLNLINELKSKYGSDIKDIIAYKEKSQAELDRYGDIEEYIKKVNERYSNVKDDYEKLSDKLHKARVKAASDMAADIKQVLMELNFLQVEFDIQVKKSDSYSATGMDDTEFLISTNPGMPMGPIANVASGGELSRIMLAVKTVLADADETETLIFDEIDTGVSGRTAQLVAEKLSTISCKHQVICITHLPQITAMADSHFLIEKNVDADETKTSISLLRDQASVEELARLLGGASITDATLNNAREMIEQAREKKQEL